MTAAQASVGRAATWPTTGTILMAALATRQGAANRPHPDNARADTRTAIRDFAMRNISANPYDSCAAEDNEAEFVSKCVCSSGSK
jgi:hypothetical protein